jgi:hypothetical protein
MAVLNTMIRTERFQGMGEFLRERTSAFSGVQKMAGNGSFASRVLA